MQFGQEHRIEISASDLFHQSKDTAHDYLSNAIRTIDEQLGKGFAKQHPELIAAYMQTCVIDFGASLIAQQIRCGLEEIAVSETAAQEIRRGLDEVAEAINSLPRK